MPQSLVLHRYVTVEHPRGILGSHARLSVCSYNTNTCMCVRVHKSVFLCMCVRKCMSVCVCVSLTVSSPGPAVHFYVKRSSQGWLQEQEAAPWNRKERQCVGERWLFITVWSIVEGARMCVIGCRADLQCWGLERPCPGIFGYLCLGCKCSRTLLNTESDSSVWSWNTVMRVIVGRSKMHFSWKPPLFLHCYYRSSLHLKFIST